MRRVGVAALALAALAMLAGCGADEPEPTGDGTGELTGEVGDALEDAGVDLPEVCLTQFLGVMSTPDLDEVGLPDSWPEPPVEATLCKTEGGSAIEEVGYATDATPTEVLDAYAEALAQHTPERTEDDGYGAGTLTGVLDGVTYVVQPRTGSYEIVLSSP